MATAVANATTPPVPKATPALHSLRLFHLLPIAAACGVVILTAHSIVDPDLPWHIRLGQEMAQHHSLTDVGQSWSLIGPNHAWRSSEWLAEITFYGIVQMLGLHGLLLLRTVLVVLILAALGRAVLHRRDAWQASIVYAVTALALAPLMQARPQTFSLLMLVYVAACINQLLSDGRLPHHWQFIGLTWLWAQIHGLWIAAPVGLATASLLRGLDDRSELSTRMLRPRLGLAATALLMGCLNPNGFRSLTLPLTLRAATRTISEWQPTTFYGSFTWALLILVLLLVFAWRRAGTLTPRSELAWTGLCFAFALTAYRNVGPATLLIAPLASARLSAVYGRDRGHLSRNERRVVVRALGLLAFAGVVIAAVTIAAVPTWPSNSPVALAERLNDGQSHRVLNAYNVSGLVLLYGGPKVRVAVDGRADYYGGRYLNKYEDMMNLRSGWRAMFNSLHADRALIHSKAPLHAWLASHGWQDIATKRGWALLGPSAGT